jgi:hypothetical protein
VFVKDKRMARLAKLALKKGVASSNSSFTELNLEKLKGSLSYFSYLYANGEISDKAFDALVRQACSIFIENEVEERLQEALERRLLQFLHSKLSSFIEEEFSNPERVDYGSEVLRLLRSK